MYLLHLILSEYQQVPQYASRDAGLSFVDSVSALTPHPSIHDPPPPLYASCSIHVFPFPPICSFFMPALRTAQARKILNHCVSLCVCVYAYMRAGTCFWIVDDNHYIRK